MCFIKYKLLNLLSHNNNKIKDKKTLNTSMKRPTIGRAVGGEIVEP